MRHLLLDEMYPPSLARALRAGGVDAVAVPDPEIGLANQGDVSSPPVSWLQTS